MVTQEYLKKRLHYDKDTGVFTWIDGRNKGNIAGGKCFHEYWRIKLLGKTYKAHRLAWLYSYGVLPDAIDHINQDRTDNSLCNLRVVDGTHENGKNRGLNNNNKSGVAGVCFAPSRKKWLANIADNGKKIYLGAYEDKKDAIKARKVAEIKYGYHSNHGFKIAPPIHEKRKRVAL